MVYSFQSLMTLSSSFINSPLIPLMNGCIWSLAFTDAINLHQKDPLVFPKGFRYPLSPLFLYFSSAPLLPIPQHTFICLSPLLEQLLNFDIPQFVTMFLSLYRFSHLTCIFQKKSDCYLKCIHSSTTLTICLFFCYFILVNPLTRPVPSLNSSILTTS